MLFSLICSWNGTLKGNNSCKRVILKSKSEIHIVFVESNIILKLNFVLFLFCFRSILCKGFDKCGH
jgi:hypothetical protein